MRCRAIRPVVLVTTVMLSSVAWGTTPTPGATSTPTPCVELSCDPYPLTGDGGHSCAYVTAPADCCWMASVTQGGGSAATITDGQSGCGAGAICFNYGINFKVGQPSFVEVTAGGRSCSIDQLLSLA